MWFKIMISIFVMFCINAKADMTNNVIIQNSVIKAEDINNQLNLLRTDILLNGALIVQPFKTVISGQLISKKDILNEIYKINQIYPLGNELHLGNTISSIELNALFTSVKNSVLNYVAPPIIAYNAIDKTPSCMDLNLIACDGTRNVPKSYSCERLINGVVDETYISNVDDCSLIDLSDKICLSPSGDIIETILNGTISKTCELGSSTVVSSTVNCEDGYVQSENQCLEEVVPFFNRIYSSADFIYEKGFNDETHKTISLSDGSIIVTGYFRGFLSTNGWNINKEIIKFKPDGSLDEEFISNIGSGLSSKLSARTIRSDIVLDPNGQSFYIVGDFDTFNGVTNNARGIAKCSIEGVFDQNFSDNLDVVFGVKSDTSGFSYGVRTVATDGSNLWVGGDFATFKNVTNNARGIAKLSTSGVFDQAFSDNLDVVSGLKSDITSGFSGNIYKIVIGTDNMLYIGGGMTRFKGTATNTNRLAKMTKNGELDQTFSNNLDVVSGNKSGTSGFSDGVVYDLFIDNLNIYVGGSFSTFKGVNYNARGIAKLSTSGVFDQAFSDNLDVVSGTKSFTSGFNFSVKTLIKQGNSLFVGGDFTAFKNVTNNAKYIAKLSTSGVFDQAFSDNLDVVSGIKATTSGFSGSISSFNISSQNELIINGAFNYYKNNHLVKYFAKLNLIDNNVYSPIINREAMAGGVSLAEDSDGNIYFSGKLNHNRKTIFSGANCHIIKMNKSFEIDEEWRLNFGTIGFDYCPKQMKFDASNNLYAIGSMTSYNGVSYNSKYIAKFNKDGVFDQSFSDNLDAISGVKNDLSGFNGGITSIAIDSSYIYLVGSFTSYNGKIIGANAFPNNARYIAKLSHDGLYNKEFNDNLVRINGQYSAQDGFNNTILSIDISNGNLFVGGDFTSFKGISFNANRIAKISTSGVFNQEFSNNLDIISGTKTYSSGIMQKLTSLIISDNSLFIGGLFQSISQNNESVLSQSIAKLDLNGLIDKEFSQNLSKITYKNDYSRPEDIKLYSDSNNIYITGVFSKYNNISNNANGIIKLSKRGVFDQEFSDSLDLSFGIKNSESGFTMGSSDYISPISFILPTNDGSLFISGNNLIFKNTYVGSLFRFF